MKYLLFIIPFMFLGCYDASPTTCKERGYKGIVITDKFDFGDNACSNGDIVFGNFITSDGNLPVGHNTYFGFDGTIIWMQK